MSELFENVDPGEEITAPDHSQEEPVDIFDDEDESEQDDENLSEFMQNDAALSAAESKYISDVEAYASRIIAQAQAEAQRAGEALRSEIFKEIAQKKAEADAQCLESEQRAADIIRIAEETNEAAEARYRDADKAASEAEAAAAAEASKILEEAKAEADEIRLRAQVILAEAKAEREKTLDEHSRIENDGRDYLEVMERHAQTRLDMISELLRTEQEWAFKSRQNVEDLTRMIAELREKYEEDYGE